MSINFTVYHNSQSSYNAGLGHGWSHSYEMYIVDGVSTAIVHYGDGGCVPYTKSGSDF